MSKSSQASRVHRYLHYTLTLRAAVVMTESVLGDPNSAASMMYIPGSAMRGVVAGRLLKVLGQGDELFKRIILSGEVRFLNAYPKVRGVRTRPAALSYFMSQDGDERLGKKLRIFDLAAHEDLGLEPGSHRRSVPDDLVAFSAPFVWSTGGTSFWVRPRLAARLHNQRDRVKGRAWKKIITPHREERHGEIFSFEYLEAGQEFKGAFLLSGPSEEACSELIAHLQTHLAAPAPILLGKSRTSGYGGSAMLELEAPENGGSHQESIGARRITEDVQHGDHFRLVLTSDYIGRNSATGQLDPSFIVREIEAELGYQAEVVHKFWSFGRTGGFNRKWRLQIPQAPTCVAGSVFVLRATASIPFSRLTAIEHAGLGIRRIDGFGRIVFAPGKADGELVLARADNKPRLDSDDPTSSTDDRDLMDRDVYQIERRLLQFAVREAIASTAHKLSLSARHIPNTSVLGRLRVPLRRAPRLALDTMRVWLSDDKELSLRRPAIDQLERCIIGGVPLIEWLKSASDIQKPLDSVLNIQVIAQRNFLTTEENARRHFLDPEFEMTIRVRLLDAVLEALMRNNRHAMQSEGRTGT